MTDLQPSRRGFLKALGALSVVRPTCGIDSADAVSPSRSMEEQAEYLTPWKPGLLDIHHISTGRGNATLAILPDGTTLMIDAGAIYESLKYTIAPRPDASRRPGEWIAEYVARHLKAAGLSQVDTLLLTHFHPDHIGQCAPGLPETPDGYVLTGAMDLAHRIHIARVIDRGYPDYAYPTTLTDPSFLNYRRWIDSRSRSGLVNERFRVGSSRQMKLLRSPERYPTFAVRNLAGNGHVWTGNAEEPVFRFPTLPSSAAATQITENMCSLALRLDYGPFRYYSGGDLTNDTAYGQRPWANIEATVAEASGRVDVAVVNHHGYVNGAGPEFVRNLRPQAFVIFAWDSAHPAISPLANMLSKDLYPDERSVYSTAIKPENLIVNKDTDNMAGTPGHVVVRVEEQGFAFTIYTIDSSNIVGEIMSATHHVVSPVRA